MWLLCTYLSLWLAFSLSNGKILVLIFFPPSLMVFVRLRLSDKEATFLFGPLEMDQGAFNPREAEAGSAPGQPKKATQGKRSVFG